MTSKLFVSYRRSDSLRDAFLISGRLKDRYGSRNVFIDENLSGGQVYRRVLDKRLAQCSAMLAIVGPDWLEARDTNGEARLLDSEDWVRHEIRRALERGIPVIPVLLNGAALPAKSALPDDIAHLVDHQAVSIRTSDHGFRGDMSVLFEAIDQIRGGLGWLTIGGSVAALAFAILIGVWQIGAPDQAPWGSLLRPTKHKHTEESQTQKAEPKPVTVVEKKSEPNEEAASGPPRPSPRPAAKSGSGDPLEAVVGKAKAEHLREQHAILNKEGSDRPPTQVPGCNSALLPIDARALGSRFSCLLVDHKTGAALMATKPDAARSTSSLAKLMTLYIAFKKLEQGELSLVDTVVISESALLVAPTKLGVPAGTRLTVEEAIQAIIIKSANDVAVSLAERISGTEVEFVAQMNKSAANLSMRATKFTNSTGLPDAAQISSAIDLATLARAIISETGEYYRFYSTRSFVFGGKTYVTPEDLFFREAGFDGFRGGFTAESGFNIVFSAEREGNRVVGVILGMESRNKRDAFIRLIADEAFKSAKEGRSRVNYKVFAQ